MFYLFLLGMLIGLGILGIVLLLVRSIYNKKDKD